MKVLVTGAAGGIGAATAEAFERAGHDVLRHDVRTSDGIDVAGDLLDYTTLQNLAQLAEGHEVDTVIAAHGIPGPGSLDAVGPEYIERVVRVNTTSVFSLFETLQPVLRARRGAFVAISSQAGLRGEGHNAVYAASKFSLIGWARAQARSHSPIRFRVICPGLTETPLLTDALRGMALGEGVVYEDHLAQRLRGVPLGRLGRTAEIGRAALWLAELRTSGCVVAPVTGGTVFD